MAVGDRFKMQKAAEVLSGTEQAKEVVIANNQKILIDKFIGVASESANARIKLVWDYGGTDELLWVISNELPMPDEIYFEKTGDGVKKLAIVLSNDCNDAYPMSAECEYEEQ